MINPIEEAKTGNLLAIAALAYAGWVGLVYFQTKKLNLTPWKPAQLPPLERRVIAQINSVTDLPDPLAVIKTYDARGIIPSHRGDEKVAMIMP